MSGFSGIVLFNPALTGEMKSVAFPETLVAGYFPFLAGNQSENSRFAWYGTGKFGKGNGFIESGGAFFGFDGVVLNEEIDGHPFSISTEEGKRSPEGLMSEITEAIKPLNGSFSGFGFQRDTEELVLFADQTGSRPEFYFRNDDLFAFSSSIFLLVQMLTHFGITISLNVQAAYMMLSFGYLPEDLTLVEGIRKLTAGKVLRVSHDRMETPVQYHSFYRPVTYTSITGELLAGLDEKFRKAVEAEYRKDLEYGFRHLCTLSGGLDSRLNVMIAHKNGFREMTCLTFSDGGHMDERVARQIASDLKAEHLLIIPNNEVHLKAPDLPLLLNNCSVYYFGASQTLNACRKIDFSGFGLFHNGGLAESSKGGYLSGPSHRDPCLDPRYAVSSRYLPEVEEYFRQNVAPGYPNEEMYLLYNRGFNAIHNGTWMILPFTASVSTFLDQDFAGLAFSIAPELRYNAFLTIEWIKRLYPEIARYRWTTYGIRPTNDRRKILMKRIYNKVQRVAGISGSGPESFNVRLEKNTGLNQWIQDQFSEFERWDVFGARLRGDIHRMFGVGTQTERLLVISLIKSVGLIFGR